MAGLQEDLEVKCDPLKSINDPLSLKLQGMPSAFDFILKAEINNQEAGFKMERKFVFQSKAVVINEQIQNFIILRSLVSLQELESFI